jgi:hypothetical protein
LPKNPRFSLLAAALLAGSMWFYVQHVLVPYQRADALAHSRPRGNLSDLYPRWLGSRELFLRHRDPYSAAITREIQSGYYGRPLDGQQPQDPKDQQGFAYPVYVVFLLAPTVNLPFAVVQECFRWLLIALTAISVPIWLRVVGWKPGPSETLAVVLLVLGSFPALQGIKLQQLSLLVSALLAVCLLLLRRGQLLFAGMLLAITTIKPQLAIPLAAWLLLWSLARWRERKGLALGFGLMMAALLVGSEILLPGWIGRFRIAVAAYREYTGGAGSLLDVLLTPVAGGALAGLIALAVGISGWRSRQVQVSCPRFAGFAALVLAATVVIVPTVAPYNQLLLIPAIFLLARDWTMIWAGRLGRWLGIVGAVAVAWPWAAAVTLTVGSLFLPAASVQRAWAAPLYTSYWIPLAVLALSVFHAGVSPEEAGTPVLAGVGVSPTPRDISRH